MKKIWSMILALVVACSICISAGADAATVATDDKLSLGDEKHVIPVLSTTEIGGAAAYDRCDDHENSPYYPTFDWFDAKSTDTLKILGNVRTYQQTTESTCGPASALIAYDYLGGDTSALDDVKLSALRKDADPNGATSLSMMQDIFDSLGWKYVSTKTLGLTEKDALETPYLYKYIEAGFPVIVGSMEWGGHWTVLIGYDTMGTDDYYDDVLIMADPYDTFDHCQDGYATESADLFLYSWNLKMDGLDPDDAYAPFIVAYPASMADKLPK